ncbi:MAG: hypothetical protein AAFW00_18780 [Bacteroidota bacterium]
MYKLKQLLVPSRSLEQKLSIVTKNQLIDAIMQNRFEQIHKCYPSVAEHVGRVVEQVLPAAIVQKIRSFAADGAYHTLTIRHCPTAYGRIASTPSTCAGPPIKQDTVSECFLLALSWLLAAAPHTNKNMRAPHVIQQVVPMVSHSHEYSSWGHKVSVALFTHRIHEHMAPDLVVELCMRDNEAAETYSLSVDDMILHLPPWVIEEMLTPQFMMHAGPADTIPISRLGSLLSLNDTGSYMLHYNANPQRTTGINTRAQETLAYLQQWLSGNPWVVKRVLQSGDLLIYKNKRVLVGRSAFDAHDSFSQRRWIQRLYLSKGLGTELR